VLVTFLSLRETIEKEGFILVHGFRGYSPWSTGSIVLGAVVRQNIMVEHRY
jgi:hypothetical protein